LFEAGLDFFRFQHDFIIPDGPFKTARSSKGTSELIVQSSENRLALALYDGKEKENEKGFDSSARIGIKRLWRFDASHAHRSAASHRAGGHCNSFGAGGGNTASNIGADGYSRSAHTDPAGCRCYSNFSQHRSGPGRDRDQQWSRNGNCHVAF
jgi:hypothetical protein